MASKAWLKRRAQLMAQNNKVAVRENLKEHGEDIWLARRRIDAARDAGLRIVDVVRCEAELEHTMTDGSGRRDWLFGEVAEGRL